MHRALAKQNTMGHTWIMARSSAVVLAPTVFAVICLTAGCLNELFEEDGLPFDPSQRLKPVTTPGGTPEERMAGITEAHNAVRDEVTDADLPLPDLTWSDELASIAQRHADELADAGCRLVHSSNGFGENLAWYAGRTATPEEVVRAWASERECYTFGTFMGTDDCTSACDDSGGCGHYTQLVWRNTSLVGCGVADCGEGFGHEEVWVCNYDPPGNFVGRKPY